MKHVIGDIVIDDNGLVSRITGMVDSGIYVLDISAVVLRPSRLGFYSVGDICYYSRDSTRIRKVSKLGLILLDYDTEQ